MPDYLLENHPWLSSLLSSRSHSHDRPAGTSKSSSSQQQGGRKREGVAGEAAEKAPLDAEEEEATWAALRRLREEWREQVQLHLDHFPIALRGGVCVMGNHELTPSEVSVAPLHGCGGSRTRF